MNTKRFATLALVLCAMMVQALVPVHATAQGSEHLSIYVFESHQNIKGADGNPHDAVVPANLVLKVGVPVTLTVTNYDNSPHTITASGLHLDVIIQPGVERADKSVSPVVTTVTFTPTRKGNYRWYCKLPCDARHGYWAMGPGYGGPAKEGSMAGEFVVI